MRKVKVATALACIVAAGFFGGTTLHAEAPASISGQEVLLEIMTEPVATAASIETTAIVTTTAKSTSATDETTTTTEQTTSAETETTTSTVTTSETAAETTAASQEVTKAAVTAATTVQTTAATYVQSSTAAETAATTEAPAVPADSKAITVTESEYIMLCNVVGHEYGSYWVSEYDKALVVEVIMNRVNSPLFPNTIYEVLTQRNQFSGLSYYINLGTFSSQVTDSVKAAVDLYLSDPSQFNHGYLYFTGDGYRNYFR